MTNPSAGHQGQGDRPGRAHMTAAFMALRWHVQLKLHDAVICVQAERARLVDALATQLLGQRLFRAALVLLHRVQTQCWLLFGAAAAAIRTRHWDSHC